MYEIVCNFTSIVHSLLILLIITIGVYWLSSDLGYFSHRIILPNHFPLIIHTDYFPLFITPPPPPDHSSPIFSHQIIPPSPIGGGLVIGGWKVIIGKVIGGGEIIGERDRGKCPYEIA